MYVPDSYLYLFVKRRIKCVEVFLIHLVGCKAETFTETLEMNNFTFTKELDYITHIRVINKTENVIVCCSCFLLCTHIFAQVGNYIALGLHACRRPRETACGCRKNAGSMVNKILVEAAALDFLR